MPKGSSSKKKVKSLVEGPVVKQEKPSLKPKKMGSEIDDIFAGKKRKSPEDEMKDNSEKSLKPQSKPHEYGRVVKASKINSSEKSLKPSSKPDEYRRVVKTSMSKDLKQKDLFSPKSSSRPKKKTADGLTIYTEEELGFGKSNAGGTRLCPFDCDCCF